MDKYRVALTVEMDIEAECFFDAKEKAIEQLKRCARVERVTEARVEALGVEEIAEKMFGKMRDATEEEKKFSEEYIKENSIPTGVNFWD